MRCRMCELVLLPRLIALVLQRLRDASWASRVCLTAVFGTRRRVRGSVLVQKQEHMVIDIE